MKAAALRDELIAGSVALAWDQWSQLGVSAARPLEREERAADPEALLLFTLEAGRHDSRLFDEVLDWLALNEPLVSVQRLRNLCASPTDVALVNAALDWSAITRKRKPSRETTAPAASLEPLFHGLPAPREQLDASFARHGFARHRLTPSHKSQPPRLHDPISFALRLRRMLGVGVRAEVIRTLLTTRADRLSQKVITASAAFAQRNVREGLTQLLEAGVIDVIDLADERFYSISHGAWATLLRLPAAPDIPFHHDWIPTYRALTHLIRWLQRPDLDDLSPYLLASQARTLVDETARDLSRAGIPVNLYVSLGPDYWDQFAETARALIRQAQGARQLAPA